MDVVVVESPAKAKTINKYLGKDYTVFATTAGHVRFEHQTKTKKRVRVEAAAEAKA